MNKALLAVGGSVIIAGGLLYWYLSQNGNGNEPPPPVCSDYATQLTCEANECYWCDGFCQSTPCGVDACGALGSCYPGINGVQQCNYLDNLCRCNGTSWNLVSENSTICRDDISHGTCAVNQNGIVFCAEDMRTGVDECEIEYIGSGCSCLSGACQSSCACIDGVCVRKAANTSISASDSNWICSPISGGGNECIYELDEPYAATTLTGTLNWKWGFPLLGMTWAIRGRYNGRWTVLKDGAIVMSGTEGTEIVSAMFLEQGIEALKFETYAACNVKPDYFVGRISY